MTNRQNENCCAVPCHLYSLSCAFAHAVAACPLTAWAKSREAGAAPTVRRHTCPPHRVDHACRICRNLVTTPRHVPVGPPPDQPPFLPSPHLSPPLICPPPP